ncbi:response regulator [Pseudahrensia aquimaris]|uniref:Response regulator n=1 Tax=Pseudahrensia aquimaris TaxID=744461 RepID=A0ABW3FHB1_9HYPH
MSNTISSTTVRSVLIVEDEPIIAMDMEMTLEAEGFDIFGLATNLEHGLQLLKSGTPDVAILDYNLGSETSVPLARALLERKIPFIYITGRELDLASDGDAPEAPIISKPVDMEAVISKYLS